MSKDPAFLFYYQDFAWGTRRMTYEERGAYISLLCEQADQWELSLKDIQEILEDGYDYLWPEIKHKFKEKNGKFFNKKLRETVLKRKSYCASRRYNRLGIVKIDKKDMSKHMNSHMSEHMENRNRNENRNENKDIKVSIKREGKYNPITDCDFFNDTDFKEAWKSWGVVRQKKKCSTSDRAIKMAVKKLMDLSNSDKVKAIQILDQSANSGWSDLYELKNGKKGEGWNG